MNTYHMARKRTGRRESKSRLAGLFLVVLLTFDILPARPAFAQSSPPVYTFAECEDLEEDLLLSELNQIVKSVFDLERSNLDYQAIVDRNWIRAGMDEVVDSVVDKAADILLEEEDLWDRIVSGWHPETAKTFATKVITTAFESTEFGDAVTELSDGIVNELAVELQIMTAISASSSLLCLQEFTDKTFSRTMSVALEQMVQKRLDSTIDDIEVSDVVDEELKRRVPALPGISVILGTKIAKVLAKKVSARIIGKIVTRIISKAATAAIPIAGWIIGGALILWDISQLHKGSIPQIRKALKEEHVKELIRIPIADAVEEEIEKELDRVVVEVTADMYQHWKAFLEDFRIVLRLSEQNTRFREILDSVTAHQVDKLSELVEIGEEVLGTKWLNRIIESGEFERVLALPRASFDVLREKADPDLVLSWADLADNLIIQVVETKLYQYSSPSDFADQDSVDDVIALKDPAVIEKLMRLEKTERNSLLRLPTHQTKWVLEELTSEEYIWLSSYLEGLSSLSQKELMDFAMRDRELVAKLYSSHVLQSQFQWVVALAAESQTFRTILREVTSDEVGKLSALVVTSVNVLEPEAFRLMIDSGQFEDILALPRSAFAILRDQKDPNVVIEWGNLAGGKLGQVVTTGLYSLADPWSVGSKVRLGRVLAIEHRGAVETLIDLSRDSQDRALEFPTDLARELLTSLPVDQLVWVAKYLTELSLEEAAIVAEFALEEPDVLPFLSASQNLRRKLPDVLTLSERNSDFRTILYETTATAIEKLANLTAIALEVLPEGVLEAELKSGRFKRVFELPESAFDILMENGDVSVVIDWAALALERIEDVPATLIYRYFSPQDFSSRDSLYKSLDLEDSEAIETLKQFSELQRVVLLSLSTEIARSALLSFSDEDLTWLAVFIAEMAPTEKDPVVTYLLERPELLPDLRGLGDLNSRFPRQILLSLDVPQFKTILDSTPAEFIEKLSALVSAADAAMTADELRAMIDSGQFEAVLSLPEEIFNILQATGNPDVVLAWADLAGQAVVRLVESGLYAGGVRPDSFTDREELVKVLDLGDPVAMQKVMTIGTEVRETILRLPSSEAKEVLVAELPDQILEWLAGHMNGLRPPVQQLLGRLVVEKPGLAEELESSKILTREFARVLARALELSKFKEILDATRVDAIAKLTELLVIAEEKLPPEDVVRMIESGQFETILAFPQEAFEILRETRDPALVIQWADLAGDSLVRVVETGLYNVTQPEGFQDKGELDAVLALGVITAMEEVMRLNQIDRGVILSMTPAIASPLLTSLDFNQLTWLVQSYLAHLTREAKDLFASHVVDQSELLSELEHENIREALLECDDIVNCLDFLAQRVGDPVPWWPTAALLLAFAAVALGDLPIVFYGQFYLTPSLVLLVFIALVAILAVVLIRRSRKPVQQQS